MQQIVQSFFRSKEKIVAKVISPEFFKLPVPGETGAICRTNEEDLIIDRNKFEKFLELFGIMSYPVQIINEDGCELAFPAMTLAEYYRTGNVKQDISDFLCYLKVKSLSHRKSSLLTAC